LPNLTTLKPFILWESSRRKESEWRRIHKRLITIFTKQQRETIVLQLLNSEITIIRVITLRRRYRKLASAMRRLLLRVTAKDSSTSASFIKKE
jgi:hypothetical protein